MNTKILIIANAFHTISGGDKIFAYFGKYWSGLGNEVKVVTNEKGAKFCKDHGYNDVQLIISKTSGFDRYGLVISTLAKTFYGIFQAIFSKNKPDIIFANSDQWPEVFPAVIYKIKNPKVRLIVASYIRASIFKGTTLGFLIQQKISLPFIHMFADQIVTASKVDKKYFPKKEVISIRGVIDYEFYQQQGEQEKIYDVVFVGRFHPQKNLPELLYIWAEVIKINPDARLLLIGDGQEKSELNLIIKRKRLEKNVIFAGIVDGVEKVKLLKQSKIFISASHIDSGNMALDESLACGTPGVIYNLPLVDFSAGVVKVTCFDKHEFAKKIIEILENEQERSNLSQSGKEFAKSLDYSKAASWLETSSFLTP